MTVRYMSGADWAKEFNASELSRPSTTASVDEWHGGGNDSIGYGAWLGISSVPGLLDKLGLKKEEDYADTPASYQHDNYIDSQTFLSDKAREKLKGFRVGQHSYQGRHVQTIRDADGKLVGISSPGGRINSPGSQLAEMVATTIMTGGLGAAAGAVAGAAGLGSAASSIASGAARGGAGAGLSNGNILQGAVTGGLSAAIPQIPGLSSLPKFGQQAIAGGLGAAIRGGNLQQSLQAALLSGASSGVGTGLASAGVSNNLLNTLGRNLIMQRLRAAIAPPPRKG